MTLLVHCSRYISPMIYVAIALICNIAWAEPPQGADPLSPLAQWYKSLKIPGSEQNPNTPMGISCCSVADCRPIEYRIAGDHYEVLIDDKEWFSIPNDRVVKRENPTGHAVWCHNGLLTYCFVPPSEV